MHHQPICELLAYAEQTGLLAPEDRTLAANALLQLLGEEELCPVAVEQPRPLHKILLDLCRIGYQNGRIPEDSVTYFDLFDTALMGVLTPRPSQVQKRFWDLYAKDPAAATEDFYQLAIHSNYIRADRIAKDKRWVYPSPYGALDITINLSKPEKDPRDIAAAKAAKPSGYPKCLLCPENEGYAGNAAKPARQNLRMIPFPMAGNRWYLQYSPYVYYNEHCIALSAEHTPMRVDRSSFEKLLGFVRAFPHYFIGQNADLPIVGGSILSHDHMQGGRYTFAMEKAPLALALSFPQFPTVSAGIVRWPMSVLRLRSRDTEALVALSDKILEAWRGYTHEEASIFAQTNGEPHNTITPIARRRGEDFELDLVLRNNLTTPEYPLGLYHPHPERHNIKKENIGLIEVMGLAVLPARLKGELEALRTALLENRPFEEDPVLSKHAAWVASFRDRYTFTPENTMEILEAEVGKTFLEVLCDAGVMKSTEDFLRFVSVVGGAAQ